MNNNNSESNNNDIMKMNQTSKTAVSQKLFLVTSFSKTIFSLSSTGVLSPFARLVLKIVLLFAFSRGI